MEHPLWKDWDSGKSMAWGWGCGPAAQQGASAPSFSFDFLTNLLTLNLNLQRYVLMCWCWFDIFWHVLLQTTPCWISREQWGDQDATLGFQGNTLLIQPRKVWRGREMWLGFCPPWGMVLLHIFNYLHAFLVWHCIVFCVFCFIFCNMLLTH